MRLGLACVLMFGGACGKQLNPDFCDAHPSDDRCIGPTADVRFDARVDVDLGSCPATYTTSLPGSSSLYRVVDDVVLWPAAETDCGDDGATTHLIVLNNDAERQALMPFNALERHIGYSDAVTEGTWIPVTDDPDVYADLVALSIPPWLSTEPNQGSTGNCLTMSYGLDFRDRTCGSEAAAYICECDAYAPNPANF